MTNPYTPPRTAATPRGVFIHDRTRLVLPRVCVVCGASSDEFAEYTQDSAPIVLPGVGFVRTMNAVAPYCSGHAASFRLRCARFRWAQGAAYVFMLVAIIFVVPPFSQIFALPLLLQVACYTIATAGFLYLVASIFILKPYLYDISYATSGKGLRIKCQLPFLEGLIAANPGNVETVA